MSSTVIWMAPLTSAIWPYAASVTTLPATLVWPESLIAAVVLGAVAVASAAGVGVSRRLSGSIVSLSNGVTWFASRFRSSALILMLPSTWSMVALETLPASRSE